MISDNYNYHFTTSILKMQNTLSPRMTWQAHISWIVNKLNQRLRVLRRVKLMLSLQYRLTLYNSLVLPLFDIFWGDTLIENLQILLNKAAKIILDRLISFQIVFKQYFKYFINSSSSTLSWFVKSCLLFSCILVDFFKLALIFDWLLPFIKAV